MTETEKAPDKVLMAVPRLQPVFVHEISHCLYIITGPVVPLAGGGGGAGTPLSIFRRYLSLKESLYTQWTKILLGIGNFLRKVLILPLL